MTTNNNCPHCGRTLPKQAASACPYCKTPLHIATTVHGGSLAKLIVHLPGEQTHEEFLAKPRITLGRRKTNMVQIKSRIVSGEHAILELTRDGHTITDLASTNGTFVNGKPLVAQTPHLLKDNDIIRFSDQLGNSAKITYIAPTIFAEVDHQNFTRSFELNQETSMIGRNPASPIFLEHPAVSWHHAQVLREPDDEDYILDLSSNNGTFINGKQLRAKRRLAKGDVVQIGPFNLIYQGAGVFSAFSAERNFRLEAVALDKTFYATNWLGRPDKSQSKQVIREFNLVINPREFIALVGGSGTGKSTLLKMLCGLSEPTAGTVLDDLHNNYNLYRTLLGYVPQDDIIHTGLTVRNALQYAAQLRLPDTTADERTTRIDAVLHKVSIAHEGNTLIGDLSGGQRKRVSIAVELLAEPWIFFLDEPTSGLDPGLEKLMMDTLRQLADEGRTIILVTHATSNIMDNCDHVVFLARNSRIAFFGPPAEALPFFEVENFADVYTELSERVASSPQKTDSAVQGTQINTRPTKVSGGQMWAERYHQSDIYQTYVTNRQTGEVARQILPQAHAAIGYLSAGLAQFSVLTRRYLDLIRNDRSSLIVLLAVMPIISLFLLLIGEPSSLVGNTTEQISQILAEEEQYLIARHAQTLLFMMALAATLLGLFSASFEIVKERPIYQRERMINLHLGAYFLSKFVVLGGFALLQCLLLLGVLAIGVSYPFQGVLISAPLEYYITLVLTTFASIALGLFVSAAVKSRNSVIYVMLVVMFVQIVLSGAIFELGLLTEPLSYLTITRWSLEGLGASTHLDSLNSLSQVRVINEVDFGRGVQRVEQDVRTSVEYFVNYSTSVVGLGLRWFGLLVHTVLWSFLTVWVLSRE